MTDGTLQGPSRVLDGKIQARFLWGLVLALLAGTVLLFVALHAVLAKPLPPTYAGTFFALRHQESSIFVILVLSVTVYVLVVSAAIAVQCIMALHRVAGPLYRMERILQALDAGVPVAAVFFRRGDQAGGLDRAFNGFLARLREDRRKAMSILEEAERLSLQDESTHRAARLEALERLSGLLSAYR